jgi:hypothetical protein
MDNFYFGKVLIGIYRTARLSFSLKINDEKVIYSTPPRVVMAYADPSCSCNRLTQCRKILVPLQYFKSFVKCGNWPSSSISAIYTPISVSKPILWLAGGGPEEGREEVVT